MTPDQYKELIGDLHRRHPDDLKLEYAWKRGGKVKRSFMVLAAVVQWVFVIGAILAVVAIAKGS